MLAIRAPAGARLPVLWLNDACSAPRLLLGHRGQAGCGFTALLLSQPGQQEKSKHLLLQAEPVCRYLSNTTFTEHL